MYSESNRSIFRSFHPFISGQSTAPGNSDFSRSCRMRCIGNGLWRQFRSLSRISCGKCSGVSKAGGVGAYRRIGLWGCDQFSSLYPSFSLTSYADKSSLGTMCMFILFRHVYYLFYYVWNVCLDFFRAVSLYRWSYYGFCLKCHTSVPWASDFNNISVFLRRRASDEGLEFGTLRHVSWET